MKLKDRTIIELESMEPSEIIKIYDMAVSLKSARKKPACKSPESYIKVRSLLKNIKGSLGNDIISLRDERI